MGLARLAVGAALLCCARPGAAVTNVSAVFAPNPAVYGSQPPPCVGSVAALTDNGTALVFGGVLASGALAAADVWEYSPVLSRWARVCSSATQLSPPPRTGHTASFAQGKLVVFGGRDAAGGLMGDAWVFDALRIVWREVALLSAVQPPSRAGHAAALMPTSPTQLTLLAFGGASGTVVLDDVWRLSMTYDALFQNITGNWTSVRTSASVALSSDAAGVLVPSAQRLLLAGPALLLLCAW